MCQVVDTLLSLLLRVGIWILVYVSLLCIPRDQTHTTFNIVHRQSFVRVWMYDMSVRKLKVFCFVCSNALNL